MRTHPPASKADENLVELPADGRRGRIGRGLSHYRFIDTATQGYVAITGLLILLFHQGKLPFWPALVAAHALTLVAVHGLIQAAQKRQGGAVVEFLRHFYPLILYTALFRETGLLNRMIVHDYLDPFFMQIEEMIFGLQPAVVFMDRLPFWWVSELFYAAYFSYYVMITGVGIALYVRRRGQFFHYLSVVSFVFYVCYLTYIFLPVVGPRLIWRDMIGANVALTPELVAATYPPAVEAGPFFQIMRLIYEIFETPGAAFPSSHVAVALVTLHFSRRYLPAVRRVHTVAVVLLCLSTVYCRYHYAVDVVAGVLVAAALIPVGNRLYARFEKSGAERPREAPRPAGVSTTDLS